MLAFSWGNTSLNLKLCIKAFKTTKYYKSSFSCFNIFSQKCHIMIIRITQVIMGDAASATEMTHSLYLASSLCYSGTSVLNSVTLHTSNFHLLYFRSLMYNRHSERCQNITKPKVWWLSQHSKIGTFKSMTSGTICPARVWTAACLKVPGHGWGDCVTIFPTLAGESWVSVLISPLKQQWS